MPVENAPRLLNGKICQIASGSHFSLFVSDTGKLFARGKTFLDLINLPVIPTATLVPIPDQYVVKKAYCNAGSRNQSVAFLEVIDKSDGKRRKILSAGKSRFGVLG